MATAKEELDKKVNACIKASGADKVLSNLDWSNLMGWDDKELRSEIKKLEIRSDSFPFDDTLSVLKELRAELSFRDRYYTTTVSRFLESTDARLLNRSDHRRKKRSFWIECERCRCIIDLRKTGHHTHCFAPKEEVPAK